MVGMRPLFDQLVDQIAAEMGWVVVCPDPFPGHPDWDVWQRFDGMGEIDAQAQRDDILAAADLTGCDRVGLLGFCLGGFHAYQVAGSGRFAACVGLYGPIKLYEPWRSGKGQREPLAALTGSDICPLLALIGGKDPGSPPQDIEELQAVKGVEVVVYPEAEHAFVHDPARPAHRPRDAADAWIRSFDFLERYAKA
jgi:carboxymethylenebutenolidase